MIISSSLFYRFTLSVAVALLSSCSSMLFTSIDILRPAKVTFPTEVTNVVLINNSVVQSPDYGHTTQELNQRERAVNVPTDSLSIYALASLAEGLVEKEFFSSVSLEPNSINTGTYFSVPTPPEREKIEAAATRNRAEGVISLNRILVNDKQGLVFDQEYNLFVGYLEAIYETQWSIHFPLKNQIYTYTVKDTVYWESESYSRQRAMQGLPDRKSALIDGALITGEKSVNRFIPWWDKVDRYFFTSSRKALKAGMDSVYHKNWKGAIATWEQSLQTASGTMVRAQLSHNLAVVYEITGDIRQAKAYSDQSVEYLLSSFSANYDHLMTIANYNEELEIRLREVDKVNLQLGEK